jgi:hypothetical protein
MSIRVDQRKAFETIVSDRLIDLINLMPDEEI